MLNESAVEHLRSILILKFSAEELCEILNLQVEEIFDQFRDQCLEINWDEYL